MSLRHLGSVTGATIAFVLFLFAKSANAETIFFEPGTPSHDLNGPSLETIPGSIAIGEVGTWKTGGSNVTGFATCFPSGSACDPGGVPVSKQDAASAIDHYWVQGNPVMLVEFQEEISEVVAVPGLHQGPVPEEALDFVIYGYDKVEKTYELGAIKAVYDEGVDITQGGPIVGGPGSTGPNGISLTAAESDDFTSVWTFSQPYKFFLVKKGNHLAGDQGDNKWELDGLAAANTAATNCASGQGGCNPLGYLNVEIPEVVEIPEEATFSQQVLRVEDDQQRCGHQSLTVDIPGTPDDVFIPKFLCGAPEFLIAITETEGVNFNDGSIVMTSDSEEVLPIALDCLAPLPAGADPQQNEVLGWQPTVASDVREGRTLDIAFDCGSSRGRTRGLSYVIIGLRIDTGYDWFTDPNAVIGGFKDITFTKFGGLIKAVLDAEGSVDFQELVTLYWRANSARRLFVKGKFDESEAKLTEFIELLELADVDTSGSFNHRGNMEMRVYNVRFMVQKVRDMSSP